MRLRIYFRFPVVFYLLFLIGTVAISFYAQRCWASVKCSDPPVFSLDVNNMPLKKIFKDILNTTGYKILFDKKWENERATVKLDNVPLIQCLKHILKNAGIENYSIVEKNRTLEVYTFVSRFPDHIASPITTDSAGPTGLELKALHTRQMREIKMRANDPDEILIPPSNGQPGVTRQELKALHTRQMREIKMRANDPDEILIPPSNGQPGVTRRELKALHEKQQNDL